MKIKCILSNIGYIIIFFSFFLLIPIIPAIYYSEHSQIVNFLSTALISFLTGFGLSKIPFDAKTIKDREGFAIVAFGWLFIVVLGALPYIISGVFSNEIDAVFESMSGFTTTGATVMSIDNSNFDPNNSDLQYDSDGVVILESVPKSIHLWRGLTQWLGGMGIIVLSLAVLSKLMTGNLFLFKAEVPGVTKEKFRPRLQETAKVLWIIYTIFSFFECTLLFAAGMSLYDAVYHTFTTMPTGGFSPKAASIAAYDSIFIEGIIIFFMFVAGISFVLHYHLLHGNSKPLLNDPEFKFYLMIITFAFCLVSANLVYELSYGIKEAMRYSLFQVVSIITTTGYTTVDYDMWPPFSKFILFGLMFIGACSGSTGGAMKQMRILLLLKLVRREIYLLIHPNAVKHIKIGKNVIPENVLRAISAFFFVYILIFTMSTLILTALGNDIMTSMGSVAATLGNVGPGLAAVGPAHNYAFISSFGKFVLILCMWLGRLELFTVLIIFAPEGWKK